MKAAFNRIPTSKGRFLNTEITIALANVNIFRGIDKGRDVKIEGFVNIELKNNDGHRIIATQYFDHSEIASVKLVFKDAYQCSSAAIVSNVYTKNFPQIHRAA